MALKKRGSEKRDFILQYLYRCREEYRAGTREEEGDYVQGIWNAWQDYCVDANMNARSGAKRKLDPGTSSAYRRMLYVLKSEGLVEHYATRPSENPSFWDRNYYRIADVE
jgi:hypothetical protein